MKHYQTKNYDISITSLPKHHEPYPSNPIPLALQAKLLLPAFFNNLTVPNKIFF